MAAIQEKQAGLSGNQLKLLAMAAMTCDHVGVQLLPQAQILRIIGRLAMPIYAYMIAEGCRHTRNRRGYLKRIAALAALCQAVYYAALGSLYQGILVSFTMSICLIFALEQARRGFGPRMLALAAAAGTGFVCLGLPRLLAGTDFAVDYGVWGVLLPVAAYFGRSKGERLGLTALDLVLLGLTYGGNQWFALASLPLLWLYNGSRGKYPIGKLFYWYYPAHLALIAGISLALGTLG